MEKKKKLTKVLTVVTSILLLVVGVTFGYYVAQVLFGGAGSAVDATTVKLDDITFNIKGEINFSDENMLPGHMILSAIEVEAINANRMTVYDLVFVGKNEILTDLKYSVYKSTMELIDISVACNKTQKYQAGNTLFRDECELVGEDALWLGDPIYTGVISQTPEGVSEETVVLAPAETFISNDSNVKYYYYIVIEYPNYNWYQNDDQGKSIDGYVKVVNSSTTPDMSLVAIYKETTNTGVYEATESIPKTVSVNGKNEKYKFNSKKSNCTNGVTVSWDADNSSLTTSGLTSAGTSCYLYFDRPACGKNDTACATVLSDKTKTAREASSTVFTESTTRKVYMASENDGTTYYFAGAPTDNYVQFAGFYWRIIRINENGSIRMIYNGSSANATGDDVSILTNAVYNSLTDNSKNVGYTYYDANEAKEKDSDIKVELDKWYKNNLLTNYAKYLDTEAGFCNDRSVSSGNYLAASRVNGGIPTYTCPNNEQDLYTVQGTGVGNQKLTYPIGLITADEARFAGGLYNGTNAGYFLYTGKNYWTMTPWGSKSNSRLHIAYSGGHILSVGPSYTDAPVGIRPVINLRADVKLSGAGTSTNPYTVSL